jgi:hypothetical protein
MMTHHDPRYPQHACHRQLNYVRLASLLQQLTSYGCTTPLIRDPSRCLILYSQPCCGPEVLLSVQPLFDEMDDIYRHNMRDIMSLLSPNIILGCFYFSPRNIAICII